MPPNTMTKRSRRSYEGVAVTVPVTVPYVRYSTRGAHWFIGQGLALQLPRSAVCVDMRHLKKRVVE